MYELSSVTLFSNVNQIIRLREVEEAVPDNPHLPRILMLFFMEYTNNTYIEGTSWSGSSALVIISSLRNGCQTSIYPTL